MIETKIAEINVAELMERVRAKADEIRRLQARPKLPPIAEVAQSPPAILPKLVAPKTQQIMQAVDDARRSITVGRWIPKPLRRFFRGQDRFDRHVLRSIESLAHTNAQLADRLRHLGACVEVQDHAIQHLIALRRLDGDWMRAVAGIIVTANERLTEIRAAMQTDIDTRIEPHRDEIGSAVERLIALESELQRVGAALVDARATAELVTHLQNQLDTDKVLASGTRGDFERAAEHLRNLQGEFDSLKTVAICLRTDLEGTAEHVRHLQDQADRFGDTTDGVRGDLDRIGEHLRNVQDQVDTLDASRQPLQSTVDLLAGEFRIIRDEFNRTGEHLRNLQSNFDRTAATIQAPKLLEEAVARLEQRLTDDGSYLKSEVSQQRSLISELLQSGGEKIRPQKGKNSVPPVNISDAFYLSFEDRFRGSRAEIKKRQQYYLPIVRASKAGSKAKPIIDVGCGRGEWLELLSEQRLHGRGVDMNSRMVAHCAERHLDVIEADALVYLRKQKAATVGAITGFHIIEHLPVDALLELFAQAHRVLVPGGIAIFESPNCKNLLVGACNFNIDPTHRNPVYPETAEFMLSLQGFRSIQLHYLAPVEGSPFTTDSPDARFLDQRLFGPQDFAVVGRKAAG